MLRQLGFGDLARLHSMNRSNHDAKSELTRLTQEMASGRKSSIAEAVKGDFAPITSIEMSLARNSAFRTASTEAASFASVMQHAYQTISAFGAESASNLLNASQAAQPELIGTAAKDTAARLQPVLAALNTEFGGRSVFAGEAVSGPAVADAATLMAGLTAATAVATDVASLMAAVDAWFDTGGGFESTVYLGSTTPLDPVDIGQEVSADLGFTAFDPELRATLKGIALAGLVGEGALAGDDAARAELLRNAGEILIEGESGLTRLQARLGTVEALIEEADTARAAETSALTVTRSGLLEVDPYETASRLQQVQLQLETIYAVTARMQSLSLVNYL
ncbi:flagellin [Vannielia litorea]|uniref:Flagellar hook-associated protein 3 FlgL n=1 Tax=Vannielia litorea TaxID=1217970 RepID=A0A1N6IJH6_9RHOB|nr:flagellin [Vannielia litorea]SIO32184.1 flagellar hook-associated protein 3 FlgL [Vannielia litorea]